ncbi:Meiotically up-regulated gene 89 protein [Neolecta irregularis DAH-3]|uniref:Meiotically up-regulated gene 89 protein n=1 Tax=Neolecta irregularis (strain DAH-3) TaxID=1198029 RepID=A0A1U7LVN5_NEOID|nr:Meiotically up-regulated gene 89 protein [Neolecta irregularis DAH-3]|eukprot:OLL26727.1 Meiotically up-regulated gene 89 protein [Neolecta irregularis DAH-3]
MGSNDSDKRKPKSRRPANTAFRQQRLKAWQPILTPKTVLPLFFAIGLIFSPIGGLLLYASEKAKVVIDFTNCQTIATSSYSFIPLQYVSTSFTGPNTTPSSGSLWKVTTNPGENPVCSVQFTLPTNFKPPVLFYYRLTNFYQNHRRYVKSVSEDQLSGKAVSASSLSTDCKPLTSADNGKPYYPCGLIANSLFNDTFSTPVLLNPSGSAENQTYAMTTQGIAWPSDKTRYGKTLYSPDMVEPPPNWVERFPDGYNSSNLPDLENWEAFQVWMRTAGLPIFSKLAMRNDHDIMSSGTYQVDIGLNFPVTEYGGTKSLVLSTRTVIGGQNPFLGIAYIVVGGICVLLGALFTARHLIKPRKLGNHEYLSFDQGSTTARDAASIRERL